MIANPFKSANDGADFWRYQIGMNVIPADTRNKKPTVNWKQNQNAPVSEEQHIQWKHDNAFDKGMAIIVGKVWFHSEKNGLYLNFIDLDNQKAIQEFCTRNGVTTPLTELAKHMLIEQHKNDPNRAHVFCYSTRPFRKKSSSRIANLSGRIDKNEIPAFEVKGSGEHGLAFVSPSPHKDGSNYEIIGTFEPEITEDLEQHIEEICKKYNISYHDVANDNNTKPLLTMTELFQDSTKILEGNNRHEGILRVMESLLWNNPHVPSETIKKWAWNENIRLCIPPLDQSEFEKQWKDALKFIENIVKEKGPKKNTDPNTRSNWENTDAGALVTLALAKCRRLFTDQYKVPHAQVFIADHYEIMAVDSKKFKNYLVKLFYESKENPGRVPGTDAQNKAIQVLQGKAEWDNPPIPLHLRVCRPNENGSIYYDLTDPLWRQIEVSKRGVKIINAEESPVLFSRYGQVAQALPEKDYSPDTLDRFINLTNIKNENDKLLAKVYIISTFIPGIAHPIYCPFGGPGAAKSLLQTMIKRIVDPAILDLLTIPNDKNEFIQQLGHNYMTFYDNLKEKRVPIWLPQDICSAVTGAGNSKRALFTDDDDFARKYKRCLGFNGINIAMTESDIASRSIIVKLETIARESNRPETEVLAEFEGLKAGLGFYTRCSGKGVKHY